MFLLKRKRKKKEDRKHTSIEQWSGRHWSAQKTAGTRWEQWDFFHFFLSVHFLFLISLSPFNDSNPVCVCVCFPIFFVCVQKDFVCVCACYYPRWLMCSLWPLSLFLSLSFPFLPLPNTHWSAANEKDRDRIESVRKGEKEKELMLKENCSKEGSQSAWYDQDGKQKKKKKKRKRGLLHWITGNYYYYYFAKGPHRGDKCAVMMAPQRLCDSVCQTEAASWKK